MRRSAVVGEMCFDRDAESGHRYALPGFFCAQQFAQQVPRNVIELAERSDGLARPAQMIQSEQSEIAARGLGLRRSPVRLAVASTHSEPRPALPPVAPASRPGRSIASQHDCDRRARSGANRGQQLLRPRGFDEEVHRAEPQRRDREFHLGIGG